MNGWIGVDLDGTLAVYEPGDGVYHTDGKVKIGPPVQVMVRRVKWWLHQGYRIKIMTARVCGLYSKNEADIVDGTMQSKAIEAWCLEHLGRVLEVTALKDFHMKELYDDRAYNVVRNQGAVWMDGEKT